MLPGPEVGQQAAPWSTPGGEGGQKSPAPESACPQAGEGGGAEQSSEGMSLAAAVGREGEMPPGLDCIGDFGSEAVSAGAGGPGAGTSERGSLERSHT